MINLSPSLLLIPFGIYLFVHLALTLINIKHIFKTGSVTLVSFIMTFIFFFYSLTVIGITWNLVRDYNWNTPLSFDAGGLINSGDSFNP